MNPNVPYGHIPSIAWATGRDGLLAEYGRLKRCLSSGTVAPPGEDVFFWRQNWSREHQMRASATEQHHKMAAEQMERLQTRMKIVNTAIYQCEVALGRREPERNSGLDNPPATYRAVPLLIPEMKAEQTLYGDKELLHDVTAEPPMEKSRARQWTNKQLEDMCRGRYRASDGYLLNGREYNMLSLDPAAGIGTVNTHETDLDDDEEEEEDDPAFMDFLTDYTKKLDAASPPSRTTSRERALNRLQRERYHLRRLMHAVELELMHHTVRKSELSFQRNEQQRVTHYWCRMNQIRGQLRAMGDEVDLDGEGDILVDEKRARAATPPPRPEPCPW